MHVPSDLFNDSLKLMQDRGAAHSWRAPSTGQATYA